MAGGSVFGKIQGGISGTLEKAKGLTNSLAASPTDEMSLSGAKNQRKNLMQEKQKYLCYMGMGAYALYGERKIEHEELEEDYKKLCEIDGQLDEIDKMIEKLENAKRSKNLCECGTKLSKNEQFYPNCGKRVKNVLVCKCGAELSPDMKYCGRCGAEAAGQNQQEETVLSKEVWKICICGARVPEGQAMCMECGRIVE